MPCSISQHSHSPWPTSGTFRLLIEACETKCGWCGYSTKSANNLRVHARRHVSKSADDSLRNIVISKGHAGRHNIKLTRLISATVRARCSAKESEAFSPPGILSTSLSTSEDASSSQPVMEELDFPGCRRCTDLEEERQWAWDELEILKKMLWERGIEFETEFIRRLKDFRIRGTRGPTKFTVRESTIPSASGYTGGPTLHNRDSATVPNTQVYDISSSQVKSQSESIYKPGDGGAAAALSDKNGSDSRNGQLSTLGTLKYVVNHADISHSLHSPGGSRPRISCPEYSCIKTFTSSDTLDSHFMRAHGLHVFRCGEGGCESQPFECPILSTFKDHCRWMHGSEGPEFDDLVRRFKVPTTEGDRSDVQ